ncbi:tyrosine-type recombinase/integrase [Inhella sp.]|uniref:tyrosine-type recombinase/integrase n=1 Tax=Inhella sp. TaxID=1921806 RepID=UPI0035B06D2C
MTVPAPIADKPLTYPDESSFSKDSSVTRSSAPSTRRKAGPFSNAFSRALASATPSAQGTSTAPPPTGDAETEAKASPQERTSGRKPFQIAGRSGYHAEYRFHDGTRLRRRFETWSEADGWLRTQEQNDADDQGPLLGGPERVTLGQFLGEYAHRHSIAKDSCKSEIDRINHYVVAIGAPRLAVVQLDEKRRELRAVREEQQLPSAFAAHKKARMSKRAKTYALIEDLARKKVSQVTTADIRKLMTTATTEDWSQSTIQKEIALLKAAFNSAIREWNWTDFKNPCLGIKLGKSNKRFVVVTEEQMKRLVDALSECDNPQVWPLVDLAIHSTLREHSLLSLKWSQVDLETRRARVKAKGRWIEAQLPMRAVEILRSMPRGDSDKVFSMSQGAVNNAWEGVRKKAGLPDLRFHDLRHVGATAYAKAGLGAHELMHLLGHTTTRMAEVYVNLARSDVLSALDRAAQQVSPLTPMPATALSNGKQKHARLRKSATPASNVFHLRTDNGRLVAQRVGEKLPTLDAPLKKTGSSID